MSRRLLVMAAMVLAAAATRLVPHPPNFTPIAAIALFGGASFQNRWYAVGIPLAAMFLSDVALGLHRTLPAVYASFLVIVCIGFWLRPRKTPLRIAAATLTSSVTFFLITNFAVWTSGALYPKTLEGFVSAYVAGLPFFRNTVLGDACYSALLFGGAALLERASGSLRDAPRIANDPQ